MSSSCMQNAWSSAWQEGVTAVVLVRCSHLPEFEGKDYEERVGATGETGFKLHLRGICAREVGPAPIPGHRRAGAGWLLGSGPH